MRNKRRDRLTRPLKEQETTDAQLRRQAREWKRDRGSCYCPRCQSCGFVECCPPRMCDPGKPGCVGLYTPDELALGKLHKTDPGMFFDILYEVSQSDDEIVEDIEKAAQAQA